jgi:hypothetical protein
MSPLDKPLSELAATSEELLRLLERRDPRYLEALEQRGRLLEQIAPLLEPLQAPPAARAALERIRHLGDACEREARALRQEALDALAALDPHLRFAQSLSRLTGHEEPALLDLMA